MSFVFEKAKIKSLFFSILELKETKGSRMGAVREWALDEEFECRFKHYSKNLY